MVGVLQETHDALAQSRVHLAVFQPERQPVVKSGYNRPEFLGVSMTSRKFVAFLHVSSILPSGNLT